MLMNFRFASFLFSAVVTLSISGPAYAAQVSHSITTLSPNQVGVMIQNAEKDIKSQTQAFDAFLTKTPHHVTVMKSVLEPSAMRLRSVSIQEPPLIISAVNLVNVDIDMLALASLGIHAHAVPGNTMQLAMQQAATKLSADIFNMNQTFSIAEGETPTITNY
jgi:hypothetical protein